jgi:opacity protein-like surface antigen
MKKLALVILAGISFATANAQFQFGAKGGFNFATLSGSDIRDAKTLVNFNVGVFARLPLIDRLSLQPELVYSVQGAKFSNPDESHHVNYLNIPILLRYSAGSGFGIYTGPQIGFLLSAHQKINGNSLTEKDFFNSADFAWAVGLSYKIPSTRLGIDARYNFGIANIEDRSNSNQTGSIRNDVFQLGVTYVLFSTGRK